MGSRQASVNPKAETVEELQGRRKALHIGMCKLAMEDLSRDIHAGLDAFSVIPDPLSVQTQRVFPGLFHPRSNLSLLTSITQHPRSPLSLHIEIMPVANFSLI
jgi:hypothetical protein